jgi:tRNA(Ile)-lysidine synthase
MLTKFQNHIITNFPFLLKSRFFIAVSGGIDSMVLVHLFQQMGYPFAMLHCNFQLRGKESDGDMKFVMKYGDKYLIPWSVGHLDTKGYAKEMKVSIQVAARELRYDWFYEQLKEKDFDYILTAHHLDDSLETFLINFTRGSGLEGLTGIPEQNDKIIRPLLPFSREEIEDYATKHNI